MLYATRSLGVPYSRAYSVACLSALSLYSEYSTTLPVLTDFLPEVLRVSVLEVLQRVANIEGGVWYGVRANAVG
jgi:hypothetical protein